MESGAVGATRSGLASAENEGDVLDELAVIRDALQETPAVLGSDAAASDLAWLDAVEWEGATPDAASPLEPADATAEGNMPGHSAPHAEGHDGEALPSWMAWAAEPASEDLHDGPSGGVALSEEPTEDSGAPEITAFLFRDAAEEEVPSPSASEVTGTLPEPEESREAAPAGDALHEVADRLERIAASLRERTVSDLLAANAEDPLELLLTGFALGYLSRRQNPGS